MCGGKLYLKKKVRPTQLYILYILSTLFHLNSMKMLTSHHTHTLQTLCYPKVTQQKQKKGVQVNLIAEINPHKKHKSSFLTATSVHFITHGLLPLYRKCLPIYFWLILSNQTCVWYLFDKTSFPSPERPYAGPCWWLYSCILSCIHLTKVNCCIIRHQRNVLYITLHLSIVLLYNISLVTSNQFSKSFLS